MVFEDESSEETSSLPYMHSTSSTDGLNEVPFSVEDPDYQGLELETMSPCEKHGKASERLVTFEGTDTRRRFLACAEPEGQNCGFVEWVDHQWPPTMQNALLKLWAMVEDSRSARNKLEANYDKLVQDVYELMSFHEERVVDFGHLQSAITYQHECRSELVADMKAQMAKRDAESEKLKQNYEVLLNLTRAQATVIQNLKLKHITDKQLLSEAKMNLELKNAESSQNLLKGKENHGEEMVQLEPQFVELMKAEEKLKEKIKGIQAILEK
nr:uncharacterized protein LOC109786584 [Aegilops tauschii subsp. strangulata]